MDGYQIQITTVLADKYFTKKTVLAENEFFLFTGFEDTTVTTSVHKGSSRFSVNLVVINIDSTILGIYEGVKIPSGYPVGLYEALLLNKVASKVTSCGSRRTDAD